jgi:hypothetical protein
MLFPLEEANYPAPLRFNEKYAAQQPRNHDLQYHTASARVYISLL